MLSLLADLSYSAKSFARTPGLTLVLLLTIALGIGANAAVFGFIRGLVTPNVPLPWIERTVSLFGRDAQNALGPVSYERYLALKAHGDAFDSLGAARETRNNVVIAERSTVMSVASVTPELADLLQLPLAGGVVISRHSWQNEFAARATPPKNSRAASAFTMATRHPPGKSAPPNIRPASGGVLMSGSVSPSSESSVWRRFAPPSGWWNRPSTSPWDRTTCRA